MAYQDGELEPVVGELLANVFGQDIAPMLTELDGTLRARVEASSYQNIISVSFAGSLSASADTVMFIDTYAIMSGRLSSVVNGIEYSGIIICPDIEKDMIIDMIDFSGCKMGEIMELKRYRGDTYPLQTKLGKNGNYNVFGMTFKMSTQIEGGQLYTADGIILDSNKGIVEFPFPAGSVDVVGVGTYDIQGDNGYIYTYVKDTFTLLDDLTP